MWNTIKNFALSTFSTGSLWIYVAVAGALVAYNVYCRHLSTEITALRGQVELLEAECKNLNAVNADLSASIQVYATKVRLNNETRSRGIVEAQKAISAKEGGEYAQTWADVALPDSVVRLLDENGDGDGTDNAPASLP